MICCDNLKHPFQNDPGTSQRQRVIDQLLSGTALVDGRTTADLLDFFTRMSVHINYYDKNLNVNDWQPFFRKSIPFVLAGVIRYDKDLIQQKFESYSKLFDKLPRSQSLQLLVHYFFYNSIFTINQWHLSVSNTGLRVETVLEKLILDKLQEPVRKFICLANLAIQNFQISRIDWAPIQSNPAWGLSANDTRAVGCLNGHPGGCALMNILRDELLKLLPAFLSTIQIVRNAATLSMEDSLFPLKDELRQRHSPHLALLFAFLKLFQHLQSDLNGMTKKHLDYFYQDVLKFKPREAISDNAHILFEIQNQLEKYLLKKEIQVKDGKDNNKVDINFQLTDEIVVNKTKVAELRTLFLNTQLLLLPPSGAASSPEKENYLEGLYIAPDATKADGVGIDFKDDQPSNWSTLGSRLSKYENPENHFIKPFPKARLGFILASPVLLLAEGVRTITINLVCELDARICEKEDIVDTTDGCCEGHVVQARLFDPCREPGAQPVELDLDDLTAIQNKLNTAYYYVNRDLIAKASKRGVAQILTDKLDGLLTGPPDKLCYCPVREALYEKVVTEAVFNGVFPDADELEILNEEFKPFHALNFLFSGEKGWIEPSLWTNLSVTKNAGSTGFTISIPVTLNADKPGVTFYDKEKLKEDFNTTQPLVKIELDDRIKFNIEQELPALLGDTANEGQDCCLERKSDEATHWMSLYQFFRNVILKDDIPNKFRTGIDVKVCGLKNFIVQNDESLMDVNGQVYPFGNRPKIESSFFVGSEEVLNKKWGKININLNWKDLPPGAEGSRFKDYYNGYQDFFTSSGTETNRVEDKNFKIDLSILQDGAWNIWRSCRPAPGSAYLCDDPASTALKCKLFQPFAASFCNDSGYTYQFQIDRATDFSTDLDNPKEELKFTGAKKLEALTRYGFIRIQLKCQDFQHDKYAFVLARQMSALGKLPDIVDGAVYYGVANGTNKIVTIDMPKVLSDIMAEYGMALNPNLVTNAGGLIDELNNLASPPQNVTANVWNKLFVKDDPSTLIANDAPAFNDPGIPFLDAKIHSDFFASLKQIVDWLKSMNDLISDFVGKGVVIPKEPWTPIIQGIALDYTASAFNDEIDLIHLYPYQGTYKPESIKMSPSLLPTFCDEGNLFIALKDLVPGSNLNVLFQLAEATADSESEREELKWYYLDNNTWKRLREGFEVVDDDTNRLTTSGIIKFALPENMTKDNTILPSGYHWIKAAMKQNSVSVSEVIGIHTQAVKSEFFKDTGNDLLRLNKPLVAQSISRLTEADANIKKVEQPYESFGGREPELEKHFYVRVSETLRHKGRAIQKWDYERLVLEAFPQVFKAKCVNHSFALNAKEYINDFPVAPGYVLVAVIPDLNVLKAGNSFQPKLPLSVLEDIESTIKKKTSPFVRFRAMNPRYEEVEFCLKVKLKKGRDENYYKSKLEEDLRGFMAPWAIGEYDKLRFGQCVNRSDILKFLEGLDYLDYIIELSMRHELDKNMSNIIQEACPKTPRSILIAGRIDICIKQTDCEKWEQCGTEEKPVDCCQNETIPLTDFCNDKIIIL